MIWHAPKKCWPSLDIQSALAEHFDSFFACMEADGWEGA
jgi:hypothetical protein